MSRSFDVRNRRRPEVVIRLTPMRPACFESQEQWLSWLDEAYRAGMDSTERHAIRHGVVPDVCQDCTVAYEAQMRAQGRCAKADVQAQPQPAAMEVE